MGHQPVSERLASGPIVALKGRADSGIHRSAEADQLTYVMFFFSIMRSIRCTGTVRAAAYRDRIATRGGEADEGAG
jgi:hypothetical protein